MKRMLLAVLLAMAVTAFISTSSITMAEPIWVPDGACISGTFSDVCMLDDSTGWAVGDAGKVCKREGVLYPSGSQQVWLSQTGIISGQTGWDFKGVNFVDYNNGWLVGYKNGGADKYKGIIIRMLNGVWQQPVYSHHIEGLQNTPDSLTPFLKVRIVSVGSNYQGYISCGNGYILKTLDGINWVPQRPFDLVGMEPTDTISTWYKDIWMDPNDPNVVWAMGDHSGVMVNSADGGASWSANYPSIYNQGYTFPPNTNTPYGTRVASLSIVGYDGNMWSGMGGGLTGYYNGGGWSSLYDLGRDNWNYGLALGPGTGIFTCGNTYDNIGALRRVSNDSVYYEKCGQHISWLALKGLDLPDGAVQGRACGINAMLHRYEPAELTDFHVDRHGDSLWVNWHSTKETNLRKWNICRRGILSQDVGLASTDSLLPTGAGSTYLMKMHSWSVGSQGCDSIRDVYITVRATCNDGTVINFGPILTTEGITRNMPNPVTITMVEDLPDDEGHCLKLHWAPQTSANHTVVMRSLTPTGPWTVCGSSVGCTTAVDESVPLNDRPIYYTIQHLGDGVSYSKPSNILYGIAKDSIAPNTFTSPPTGWYDSITHVITLNWNESSSSDLGGYWVCPEPAGHFGDNPPVDYTLNHSAPIERSTYHYYVPSDHRGQTLQFHVTAMDRTGNIASWSPYFWVNTKVSSQSTSPQATAYNNGRKLLYDRDGNLHLAYVSNDSVFYQKSWDDGYSWTPAQGLPSGGTEPRVSLSMDGSNVIMCWSAVLPNYGYRIMAASKSDAGWSTLKLDEGAGSSGPPYWTVNTIGPPSVVVKNDTVYTSFEKNLDTYSQPYDPNSPAMPIPVCRDWYVLYKRVPVSDFGGGGLIAKAVVIEHIHEDYPIEPKPPLTSASVCIDKKKAVHIAWGSGGEIYWRMYDHFASEWRSKVCITNTPGVYSSEPSLSLYGDVHLVWQEGNDISHISGNWGYTPEVVPPLPGNFWWSEPQNISNSPGTASLWPVYDGGYAAWSEESANGITEACCAHYSDFLWNLIPEFSKNPTQPSNYPHIAYRQNVDGGRMVTVWTEGAGPLYSLIARDTAGQVTPQFAADLGGKEPSPYTIERDGYIVYDNGTAVDYDTTELMYQFPYIDNSQEQGLELSFYQETGDTCQYKVYVNDHPLGVANVASGEPFVFDKKLPPPVKQGEGVLRIENKSGAIVTCDRWQSLAYDKATERGGGLNKSKSNSAQNPVKIQTYHNELLQNIPNPCTKQTTIKYQIATSGKVNLKIYNTAGQLVRALVDREETAGLHYISWDGRDDSNRNVSAGIYFYRLNVEGFKGTKRMVVLR